MNAARLLSQYERFADAPNAIVHLRRFILDLAVRGKLVPQNSMDEPVSASLKRGDIPVCAAICTRGREQQPVRILDLPLPWPRPAGAEWIEAYRHWIGG